MPRHPRREQRTVQPQDGASGLHVRHEAPAFGLYLTTREVMVLVGNKTLAGAYAWLARRRKQIPRRADGKVHRIDVDRERKKRRVHRMNPRSLQNLRHAS